jgi:formylmethanofuran dehydrogenase subunit B
MKHRKLTTDAFEPEGPADPAASDVLDRFRQADSHAPSRGADIESGDSALPHTVDDVACTLCGCVCDDLSVTVADNRILAVERACSLAEPWYASLHGWQAAVASRGASQIEGRAADYAEAVRHAAALLSDASAPLVYGLSRSSTDGQRAATRLADMLGGTIDTAASRCHAPSIMALQQVGESTCSLGEVANRCDLVVFWGSNPVESHPRHWQRYSVEPQGMFVPQGRADRYVVVVDTESTATSQQADCLIRVEPGRDFEVLWALRALVHGHDVTRLPVATPTLACLRELAERMKTCRSGILFFGLGLTRGPAPHANVEALLRLVTDLNAAFTLAACACRAMWRAPTASSVGKPGFPSA